MHLQPLGDAARRYLSATTQLASRNLDSSPKLALGGAYAVRAYPQNEAPGDEGYLATVELLPRPHPPGAGVWQASAFVNAGYVKFSKNPWIAVDNSRTLSRAGFGVGAALPRDWYFKASFAWRLGSQRALADVERSPRVWLQLGSQF